MEKISISNVVEFKRKKTPASQVTLINKLKNPKPKKENAEEGGNYWVHSLSTIANAFRESTNDLILDKIDVLLDKQEVATSRQTKNMFQKNIDILTRFDEYDFTLIRPNFTLTYLKKPKDKSILVIEDLPIQVLPHHVYIYEEDGIKKISACWFVAKIKEYTFEELAVFNDALYRYLSENYSEEYNVNPEFCIVVDTMNLNVIRYSEIVSRSTLLNPTLVAMKKLLN